MRVLKWLVVVVLAIAVILAGVGLALPDSVHLERAAVINARPATVFTVLNSFKLFNQWSPWADKDPNTIYQVTGPQSGVGAKESWTSQNPDVGTGSQEIIESVPFARIKQKLVLNDFDTDNTASFTLTQEGEGTKVVWSYDSHFKGSILFHYFGLFLDKMIGPDYDHGLARMKAFIEALPKGDFAQLTVEAVDAKPINIAYVALSSAYDTKAIGDALGAAFVNQIGAFMKANKLAQTDAPLAVYDACEPGAAACSFRAGIPVDRSDVVVPDDSAVKIGLTYSGKALKVVHTGAYAQMPATYDKLYAYMAANGIEKAGAPLEQYVSDPGKTPETELITHIYVPVK